MREGSPLRREGSPLRVVVVDDEPHARRVLTSLLEGEADVEVVGSFGRGADAIETLRNEDIDVAFLDVRMPEVGGFDIVQALPTTALPLVVFVTAHEEHALRAFEVGALDYLLKPFDDERFGKALARVRERARSADGVALRQAVRALTDHLAATAGDLSSPEPSAEVGAPTTSTRIAVRTRSRVEFVDVSDIRWIEADNYYVRIHTEDRSHLLRETLTRLEGRLDPKRFVRVHRSAIVCISEVAELSTVGGGRYTVVLLDGTRVGVSRTRRAQVMRALGLPSRES